MSLEMSSVQRRRGARPATEDLQQRSLDNDDLSSGSCSSVVNEALVKTVSYWKILLLGQGLAILLSGTGAVASEYELKCSLSTPFLMLALTYPLFLIHFVTKIVRYWKKKNSSEIETADGDEHNTAEHHQQQHVFPFTQMPLTGPWKLYFIVAVLNLESCYFLTRAFHYTSLTSITMMTSLSIPGAMMASRIFLKSNYKSTHYFGAAICIAGVAANVFSDLMDDSEGKDSMYPDKYMGDILAAIGGILYGVNDALVEICVKRYDQWEYLGLLGFFGVGLSLFQMYMFEMSDVEQLLDGSSQCETSTSTMLIALFVLVNYLKIAGDSYFLTYSEAALLNMCFLFGDFYSTAFSIFAEGIIPSYLSFLALLMIVVGIVVYVNGPQSGTLMDEDLFENILTEGAKDFEDAKDFEVSGLQIVGSLT